MFQRMFTSTDIRQKGVTDFLTAYQQNCALNGSIPIKPILNGIGGTALFIDISKVFIRRQDPDGEIENSGKTFFKSRMQNFCYIQVIVFERPFSHFFVMVAYLLSPNRCHWQIAKVKNYNLNVTEFLYPAFSRNFQFHRRDPIDE